jgi:hypothetical protein
MEPPPRTTIIIFLRIVATLEGTERRIRVNTSVVQEVGQEIFGSDPRIRRDDLDFRTQGSDDERCDGLVPMINWGHEDSPNGAGHVRDLLPDIIRRQTSESGNH